jgi:hypothetical protein
METLILNILTQYACIGFICAVLVDLTIRTTKTSEPCTFMEILGTIIAWPVIVGTVINSFLKDFFN